MSDQVAAQPQPQSDDVAQQSDDAVQISNQQKLDTFNKILDEVESSFTAVTDYQSTIDHDQDQQIQASTGQKEQIEGFTVSSQELPGGMKQVEAEPNPEIPPELESYLQKAEESGQQEAMQKLADLSQQAEEDEIATDPQSAKVLPITKQQEQTGFRKSAAHSIRWLVEFSHKMTKMFLGRAVYRQPDSESNNQDQ